MPAKAKIAPPALTDASLQLLALCHAPDADPAALRALLAAGADPDARASQQGQTPLMLAMGKQRDPEHIRLLLDAGADVMAVDARGLIALERESRADMVAALLEKDGAAQLAKRSRLYGTMLNAAVYYMDADVVTVMLAHGADPYPPASAMETAANEAFSHLRSSALVTAIHGHSNNKINILLQQKAEAQIAHVDAGTGMNMAMIYLENADFNSYNTKHNETSFAIFRRLAEDADFSHRDRRNRTLMQHIGAVSSSGVASRLKNIYADIQRIRAERGEALHPVPVRRLRPKSGGPA